MEGEPPLPPQNPPQHMRTFPHWRGTRRLPGRSEYALDLANDKHGD